MTVERRYFKLVDVRSTGASRSITGYAAKFNTPSNPAALGFREQILPGCFSRAIREGQDTKCLINHDPNRLLGRVANRSLSLREDGIGLRFSCDLPDTSYARDLIQLMQRKDISQCSFSFVAKRDRWYTGRDEDGNAISCRDLEDADLEDVSIVTQPVYDSTSAWIDDDDNEDDATVPPGSGFSDDLTRCFPTGNIPSSFPLEVRGRILSVPQSNARRNRLRSFLLS